MPKSHPLPDDRKREGLAAPIVVALAVKVVALAVIYCAFFIPPPLAGSAATAVLGLPR